MVEGFLHIVLMENLDFGTELNNRKLLFDFSFVVYELMQLQVRSFVSFGGVSSECRVDFSITFG